jgi:cytosine/adenosine deaminase-related metal-dependent hydrolase
VVPSFLNYNFVKSREDMRRIGEGARLMGARIDIDMTDNSRGVGMKRRHGWEGGQVALYESLDLLVEPSYAGKAVNVVPDELPLLAKYDCRLGLVPFLRLMDGVGIPLHHLFAMGVLPGLGTDAPMVSDNQSPFEIMRQMILAQNLQIRREIAGGAPSPESALWATSERVIEMATLGGARTLFMDDVAGSLEIGKDADCVIVELDDIGLRPNYGGLRTLGSLVWAGDTKVVDTVFVAGRKLLEGGRSTIWDEDDVIREAERVLAEIMAETDLPSLLAPRNPGQTHRGWTYI